MPIALATFAAAAVLAAAAAQPRAGGFDTGFFAYGSPGLLAIPIGFGEIESSDEDDPGGTVFRDALGPGFQWGLLWAEV